MKRYKITWKDIMEFWKQEKALAFFYLASLVLYFESFLFSHGNRIWEKGMIKLFTNGKMGILQGTILIGYLLMWYYGLEERKTTWKTWNMLGMKKVCIFILLRVEMTIFQIVALLVSFIFCGLYNLWVEDILFEGYLMELLLNCVELQIICGVGEVVYLNKS